MVYFGKPQQCYRCHIEAVYESWERIYNQKETAIKDLCSRYAFPIQRFKTASLLTIAFHDAGKTSLSFQQAMSELAKREGLLLSQIQCQSCHNLITAPPLDKKTEPYRHEIISGLASLYLSAKFDDLFGRFGNHEFPFEFFVIVGHHKPVNPDSFRREWDRFLGMSDELKMMGYGENEWNHVMEVAKSLFIKEGLSLPSISWKDINRHDRTIIEVVKEKIDVLPLIVQEAVSNTGETQVIGLIRETFALLKSLLIASDWEGSFWQDSPGIELHSVNNLSANNFWENVKEDIEKEPGKIFKIKEFQQKLTELSGHGIAIAPTGSGKTEGAAAWALNNKKLNGKILYVLPNQVLTNSIYERLVRYFGQDKVGLLHGSALLYQILNRVENDEPEQYDFHNFSPTKEEKDMHTLNQMMFRPIMVATVDQLLMLAFNGNKRWSVVMGEVMGGAIIFDEVHGYDGHMLALLERVTRELRSYSNILFMSATISRNLIEFLSKLLGIEGDTQIIRDKSLLRQARNTYIPETDSKGNYKSLLENEKLSNTALKKIEECINQGKRIAIVCNTVKTAQEIFRQLQKIDELADKTIMCLHSRFIARDRRKKEKKLEKDKTKSREEQLWPQVLVATQVIECGMDLDYDVLFTEGAPLEAIIQRAGRVNRERKENFKGKLHIFKQDEASEKFYPPEITQKALDILKEKANVNSEITEEEVINMIEDIYKYRKFESDPRFLNTRRILDELIYDIGGIQDLPETDLHTRFVTYKMVEVVPEQFWDDIKDKNQFVIMEHLVRMPLWSYLNPKSNTTKDDKWKVMRMSYNDEIGGTFTDKRVESRYETLFA